MGKKKNHPSAQEILERPWCYYCERDFDDLKILINHQKAKHFKCDKCGRRLNTAGGLSVHLTQVHKESLTAVENALPSRSGLEVEIFGMEGIPQDVVQQHNQRVLTQLQQAEAERRAATGNPPPGGALGNGFKKPKLESSDDLKARLAAHKARMAEKAQGGAGGSPSMSTPPAQAADPHISTAPSSMSTISSLPVSQSNGQHPVSYPAMSLPQCSSAGAVQSPPSFQPPHHFFPGQLPNGFPPPQAGLPTYPPNPSFPPIQSPMQPYGNGQPFRPPPFPFLNYSAPGASQSPIGPGGSPAPFSGAPFAQSQYPSAPSPISGVQLPPRPGMPSPYPGIPPQQGPPREYHMSPVQESIQPPPAQVPYPAHQVRPPVVADTVLSNAPGTETAAPAITETATDPDASVTKKKAADTKPEKKEKDKSSSRLIYSDNVTSPEEKMAGLARYAFEASSAAEAVAAASAG